jgi:alkanesulfonate monooxygenase SsuD/methylene tetrahydromethanopterin reductase-like flavin-dependent oxidoreductase (luciferase family)
MDYFALYTLEGVGPVDWAVRREAEGWTGLAVADHIVAGDQGLWHPVAVLGALAAATSRVTLATAYTNNLMRSPVECAQAALSLHALSGGRFELGLGAGWAMDEIVSAGLDFPIPRERAERFHEAAVIVHALLRGPCRHEGAHYKVDLAAAGPVADPLPPLTAALGGPWTIRHIGPIVDRIEINPAGRAIRGGRTDFSIVAATMPDDVRSLIALARESNPRAQIGLGMFVAPGEGPTVDALRGAFGAGFAAGMAGPPEQVARSLVALASYGVDRVTMVPLVTGSFERLAPFLLG